MPVRGGNNREIQILAWPYRQGLTTMMGPSHIPAADTTLLGPIPGDELYG